MAILESGSMSNTLLREYFGNALTSSDLVSVNLSKAVELLDRFRQLSLDINDSELRKMVLAAEINLAISASSVFPKRKADVCVRIDGTPETAVMGNPVILRQLITSLLDNALVHGFPHGGGEIVVCYGFENESMVITVQDNGIGMNQDTLKHIYEPFFTTNRSWGGMGLGLNIIHNLVSRSSGTIHCQSSPGDGSVFTILLPWKKAFV